MKFTECEYDDDYDLVTRPNQYCDEGDIIVFIIYLKHFNSFSSSSLPLEMDNGIVNGPIMTNLFDYVQLFLFSDHQMGFLQNKTISLTLDNVPISISRAYWLSIDQWWDQIGRTPNIVCSLYFFLFSISHFDPKLIALISIYIIHCLYLSIPIELSIFYIYIWIWTL